MTKTTNPAVLKRIRIERAIIRRLVKDAIAAGFSVTVSYSRGFDMYDTADESWPEDQPLASQDVSKIMATVDACDEAHLFFHRGDETASPIITDEHGRKFLNTVHHVYLVFGNDGWDVMADWSLNCESFMAGANALSDKYSG